MITIIDYGAGNLKNVKHAFGRLGVQAEIRSDPDTLKQSRALILPGVGAFKDAMDTLSRLNLVEPIKEHADKGKPLLGICLGYQLLYEKSFEDGEWDGLGILKGEVVPFAHDLKVPHMGWNQLIKNPNRSDPMMKNIGDEEYVYFVHSYFVKPKQEDETLFFTKYGIPFSSASRKEHVIGMQFHPEKSSETGMKLLKNFVELIP
ncbi:imidazole glycerol phosphate synthase subunit HisH [Melghiribacillus thermohalophilus]|uniref:Imidazole glycerol phosphate synthase subunit HisH n=1 Tax=Melghiribacillus thermohalophilus TaxID=1324956 RepID=A0A4V6P027_9BACI|nr:imidazole glycerol phosphate synthase subunit HisH [Melghiribacillus thermohalophilus]TCT25485.1 imidazole glycerol phosphate synthase subunit HisH [Melghiribacillus thermohalophilus]